MMHGCAHLYPSPLAMTNPDINLTEWIGYVAATLTTCSFVPQAILILRTRNVVGSPIRPTNTRAQSIVGRLVALTFTSVAWRYVGPPRAVGVQPSLWSGDRTRANLDRPLRSRGFP